MRFAIILFVVASTSGCASVDCGVGTIERNGTCVPADDSTSTAGCGSGTVLVANQCEPIVECDPGTTTQMPDPRDPSKTICVGTGTTTKSCSENLTCPTPASGKQTICGQIYDITDNSKFAAQGATGAKCTTPTTTGPCALTVTPYDAFAFAGGSTTPLANGGTYIDDCGRYQITDITQPGSPFIGIGIDDANMPLGPTGVTNTTGVALPFMADASTDNFEAWIAPKATTDMWEAGGAPAVSAGIYVMIFRTHKCSGASTCATEAEVQATQSGVTITNMGSPTPNNDFYFKPNDAGHTMIDSTASMTGINGTGFLNNAKLIDNLAYSGTGGITDPVTCKWETHAGATLANIVFFQVYRPQNQTGKQCAQ
jgi:hypothetical protein